MGTVVGSTWKNVSYMRALAITVSNPRTAKQRTQRGKFAACINFLQAISGFVRMGYSLYTKTLTPFNAAMSYLLRNAVKGEAPNVSIDYKRALVARGVLMPVFDEKVTLEAGKATFGWSDNSGLGDALGTDIVMVLVYNKERGMAVYDLDAAVRADTTAELTLPTEWDGEAVAVYLALCSEDGQRVSNSVCLKNDAYDGDSGSTGGETGGDGSGSGGSTGGGGNPLG